MVKKDHVRVEEETYDFNSACGFGLAEVADGFFMPASELKIITVVF